MMLTDGTLADDRKPPWSFYLEWVLLTAITIPVAWAITGAILSRIVAVVGGRIEVGGVSHITEDILAGYVFMPLLGLFIGMAQYFLLRAYFLRITGWIAATVLGWVLPLVLLYLGSAGWFGALAVDPTWSGAIAFAIIGASVGTCQWLVLRGRVPRAGLWVLITVLGWCLAGLAVGEVISSQSDVIAIALLPPIAGSVAWWLLLDRIPDRNL